MAAPVPATAPAVVLVGPPGAGKTTVGQALAARLGLPFRDTDTEVERRAGRSVAEIFAARGEAGFRSLEREAVRESLAGFRGVLALGGGAVADASTRARLAGHAVVRLTVTAETATERIGSGAGRPLLADAAGARWQALVAAREPWYERVSRASVAADGPLAEVADAVLAVVSAADRAADGEGRSA
ncbi:shikimate kinase [Streptomyces sp. NPDC007346]|uniref:shikimate kinase n=1 Tax=Streptomyces sp. NPDC007346 TaxID=3154682 RepID=UPI0034519FB2